MSAFKSLCINPGDKLFLDSLETNLLRVACEEMTIWHHDTHYPVLSLSFSAKKTIKLNIIFLIMRVHQILNNISFGKK